MNSETGNLTRISNGERRRIFRMQRFERELWGQGIRSVAGVDEAGRGPLAGPVVAAAVIVAPGTFIPFVNDSKLLSPRVREQLYEEIIEAAVTVGIGVVDAKTIDQVNILQATMQAMQIAVARLSVEPEFILVDGRQLPPWQVPSRSIIAGDRCSFSIAAASIVAKVTRDRIMMEYHKLYPQYRFDRHKGYATREHIKMITQFGFSDIHRRSFSIHGSNDNHKG